MYSSHTFSNNILKRRKSQKAEDIYGGPLWRLCLHTLKKETGKQAGYALQVLVVASK
jgi:hypothetical protein